MTDTPATVALDARPPPGPAGGTLRRDIASAYLVTAARVGAWAVVSALVYRRLGADAFAMLALIRSTVGLLAYTSLGLAPAMVRALAEAQSRNEIKQRVIGGYVSRLNPLPSPRPEHRRREKTQSVADVRPAPPPFLATGIPEQGREPAPADAMTRPVLSYATPVLRRQADPWEPVYASGEVLAFVSAVVGGLLCALYAVNTERLHSVPRSLVDPVTGMAMFFGFGMVLRLLSEAPGSLLQVRGRIALDNVLLAGGEAVWIGGCLIFLLKADLGLVGVGLAFLGGSLLVIFGRAAIARWVTFPVVGLRTGANWRDARRLLAFGVGVAIAQAADFLYAPTDYILINCLIGAGTVAVYAPAVQIDGGLLLIVTGLATVLLPHSALAHAAGDRAAVRRYYVRGTLASVALLVPAAGAVWLAAPRLLTLWLGNPMPQTLAILPIVLLNTVIGGSSAVGRSVLLAMGKVRAFSISVVIAGVVNVIVSFACVRYFHLGLTGIILGTIVAVVGRCAIWMPWYVLRAMKRVSPLPGTC